MTRVDPETASLVRRKLLHARLRGLDPVVVLNEAGLLDHPAKRMDQRRWLIRALWEELSAATPTQLGNGIIPATAADMKRCLLDALKMAERKEA